MYIQILKLIHWTQSCRASIAFPTLFIMKHTNITDITHCSYSLFACISYNTSRRVMADLLAWSPGRARVAESTEGEYLSIIAISQLVYWLFPIAALVSIAYLLRMLCLKLGSRSRIQIESVRATVTLSEDCQQVTSEITSQPSQVDLTDMAQWHQKYIEVIHVLYTCADYIVAFIAFLSYKSSVDLNLFVN